MKFELYIKLLTQVLKDTNGLIYLYSYTKRMIKQTFLPHHSICKINGFHKFTPCAVFDLLKMYNYTSKLNNALLTLLTKILKKIKRASMSAWHIYTWSSLWEVFQSIYIRSPLHNFCLPSTAWLKKKVPYKIF